MNSQQSHPSLWLFHILFIICTLGPFLYLLQLSINTNKIDTIPEGTECMSITVWEVKWNIANFSKTHWVSPGNMISLAPTGNTRSPSSNSKSLGLFRAPAYLILAILHTNRVIIQPLNNCWKPIKSFNTFTAIRPAVVEGHSPKHSLCQFLPVKCKPEAVSKDKIKDF